MLLFVVGVACIVHVYISYRCDHHIFSIRKSTFYFSVIRSQIVQRPVGSIRLLMLLLLLLYYCHWRMLFDKRLFACVSALSRWVLHLFLFLIHRCAVALYFIFINSMLFTARRGRLKCVKYVNKFGVRLLRLVRCIAQDILLWQFYSNKNSWIF